MSLRDAHQYEFMFIMVCYAAALVAAVGLVVTTWRWWRETKRRTLTSVIVDTNAVIPIGTLLKIEGRQYRVTGHDKHTITVVRV